LSDTPYLLIGISGLILFNIENKNSNYPLFIQLSKANKLSDFALSVKVNKLILLVTILISGRLQAKFPALLYYGDESR